MHSPRKEFLWLIFLIAFTTGVIYAEPVSDDVRTRLLDYRSDALEWIHAQKAPNDTVPDPVPQRRNLVISYDIPEDDPAFPYLAGRSYIYDAALAAIAFTMVDRYREAEDVLLALNRQLRPDGSLWFGVNVHNEWPSEQGHDGATIRSGASSWAGYAATYYLRKRATVTPEFHQTDRVGRQILSLAETVARSLGRLQIVDRRDPRYGLITGGMGTYTLALTEDESVLSVYSDETIGWASTEHNIDAYFLLRDLAEITGTGWYTSRADMVRDGLLRLWDDESRQLIQGIKVDGLQDTVLPLDTSSWGSMMLRAADELDKAERTLDTGFNRFQLGSSGHFRPYANDPVYLDGEVTRRYLGVSDLTWNDLEIAWPEGSLGMATALIKGGRYDDAVRIIDASLEYSRDGALQYASMEVPHQFSTYPSVASTAWLVIAIENLLDPQDRILFWSYP